MIKRHYMYVKDIQKYLSQYYEKYGKKITFAEAVVQMEKYKTDQKGLIYPDYAEWDGTDFESLKKIHDMMPVDITYFLNHPKDYQSLISEKTDAFAQRDVDIIMPFFDEAIKVHQHDFFEIAYLLSGTGILHFEKEKKVLEAGDFCIISPYTDHDVELNRDTVLLDVLIRKSTFEHSFYNVLQGDSILASFFGNCLYLPSHNYLLMNCVPNRRITNTIRNMLIESISMRPYTNEIENLYLSLLLAEVLRSHTRVSSCYQTEIGSNIPISLILTYIKSNYRNITLGAVAEFFGYDTAYLGKMIKMYTNMYYNEIVNKCKIDQAVRLLKNSDYSLQIIGEQVGFNSYDHFSRTFKKVMGVSPKNYRKQH